jgi:hypothetical protein
MGYREIKERLPEVAAELGEDMMWTNDAEEVFIKICGKKPK